MTNVEHYDAVIVGAGPAGMSAAIEITRHGGSALVVDEQSAPGGQIYRGAEVAAQDHEKLFGQTYRRGASLISEFRNSGSAYLPNSLVVSVDKNLSVGVVCAGEVTNVRARSLIFATGAYERPVPLEGWTLPGVMTAGAAQVLAKQSGVVPAGRIVLVGNGALLWLLAWQLHQMGVKLTAIVEMDVNRRPRGVFGHFAGFMTSPYAGDAMKYLWAARRRTRIVRARSAVKILGSSDATGVEIESGKGEPIRIDADTVLMHDGVIPNVHLSGAAGCELKWSISQRAWRPQVDEWQRSSGRTGIYIAGDGAGIQGASAAEATGALAALDALFQAGKLTQAQRDIAAIVWRSRHQRSLKGRQFIDKWFVPVETARLASAETLLCRCEAVTQAEVAHTIRLQPVRLAHLKSTTRCGMGPCQGRMCMPSIGSLAMNTIGVHPTRIGPPSFRFPVKPLSVAALAGFEAADQFEAGSVRE